MATNIFDKLNISQTEEMPYKSRSIPYEDYFGEMELDEEEKKDRIELAEKLEVLILYFFLLYQEDKGKNYESMISDKYEAIANDFLGSKRTSAYIKEYARKYAQELQETTRKHDRDDWYISLDRARFGAENEANSIGSYREQTRAVKDGKRYKTWVTMKDRYVRHTHVEADETTIGIFEDFHVGNSVMAFPKASTGSPEEVVNCRCVLRYS